MLDTIINPIISRERKILIVAAIIIALLAITTVIAVTVAFITLKGQKPAPIVERSKAAMPEPALPKTPSPFATDAGVLKLRDDLQTLSAKVDSIDLFEAEITPPSLDLSISIK